MQNLQSQKDIYTAIAQDLRDLSPKLSDNGISTQTEQLVSDIRVKVQDFSLKMMVYGMYNAGKSTLINALIGQEVAKMSPTPETDTITDYKYKDYVIYDTPGLNAKDAHTQETQKCYQTCELVLFVLSNENVDEAVVFNEIAKIKNDKKPIIIAINEKQDLDETQWAQIESQVYKNIEKLGFEDAKDSISVYRVNAKSALKAKLENKNALLDDSRLPELELGIKILFEKSGAQHIINALNNHISGFINEAKSSIDSKIDNKIIAIKEAFITRTENARRAKSIELNHLIDTEVNKSEGCLKECKNEDDIKRCFGTIALQIQEKLGEVAKELQADIDSVQLSIKRELSIQEKATDFVQTTLDWVQVISSIISFIPLPQLTLPARAISFVVAVLTTILKVLKGDGSGLLKQDQVNQIQWQFTQSLRNQVKEYLDRLYGDVLDKAGKELDSAKGANGNLLELKIALSSIDARLPIVNL